MMKIMIMTITFPFLSTILSTCFLVPLCPSTSPLIYISYICLYSVSTPPNPWGPASCHLYSIPRHCPLSTSRVLLRYVCVCVCMCVFVYVCMYECACWCYVCVCMHVRVCGLCLTCADVQLVGGSVGLSDMRSRCGRRSSLSIWFCCCFSYYFIFSFKKISSAFVCVIEFLLNL